MTDGRPGDAEILSNGVELTPVRLPAPRLICAARRVTRACIYLGLGVLAILSVSIGGFLLALARGPIGFDWLTPVIVKSLDEHYAHRYDFGLEGVAFASTEQLTGLRNGRITFCIGSTSIKSPSHGE